MSQSDANKSPVVAYLLWFFIGIFGAHRFYMGRTKSGLAMLGLWIASAVLSIVGVGLLGFLALSVWWVVDAFLLNGWLKDASAIASYADQPSHADHASYPNQDQSSQQPAISEAA